MYSAIFTITRTRYGFFGERSDVSRARSHEAIFSGTLAHLTHRTSDLLHKSLSVAIKKQQISEVI
jgi:hypothetical protein